MAAIVDVDSFSYPDPNGERDFDISCLSKMIRYSREINRRYGEQQMEASKNGVAVYRKGNVQLKFEDFIFAIGTLETMIGINCAVKTGLHEKKRETRSPRQSSVDEISL